MAKLLALWQLCDELGVDTGPAQLSPAAAVLPLESWCHAIKLLEYYYKATRKQLLYSHPWPPPTHTHVHTLVHTRVHTHVHTHPTKSNRTSSTTSTRRLAPFARELVPCYTTATILLEHDYGTPRSHTHPSTGTRTSSTTSTQSPARSSSTNTASGRWGTTGRGASCSGYTTILLYYHTIQYNTIQTKNNGVRQGTSCSD